MRVALWRKGAGYDSGGDIKHGGWSGWYSLGGVLTSDPAVGRNADGRLEVFVTGTDGALWRKWQVTPNGSWSGWALLQG